MHVTSTSAKDLAESRMDKRIGSEGCSTTRRRSCSTNPIRDRSGRPDDMQDGRNTSRSQEIRVNSFNEELSSSDGTERPVVLEDKMSLNVEQTHDRTGRLVAILHTAAAQDDSQERHEGDTINVDDEVLRKKRMEKSIPVHDESQEPMMVNEADMYWQIPGLPHL